MSLLESTPHSKGVKYYINFFSEEILSFRGNLGAVFLNNISSYDNATELSFSFQFLLRPTFNFNVENVYLHLPQKSEGSLPGENPAFLPRRNL